MHAVASTIKQHSIQHLDKQPQPLDTQSTEHTQKVYKINLCTSIIHCHKTHVAQLTHRDRAMSLVTSR